MTYILADADVAGRRARADRPSPAVPLVLLAVVVIGGIGMSFVDSAQNGFSDGDLLRLAYWSVATVLAFGAILWLARRQGHRTGLWVNRRGLVVGGIIALGVVVVVVLVSRQRMVLPGDLTLRGNLPLLALTVGVALWATRERRPGLWVVAAVLAPFTLLANLYNMENLLFRFGVPYFQYAQEVVNLAVVAVVLLIAAAVFGLAHRRDARRVRERA